MKRIPLGFLVQLLFVLTIALPVMSLIVGCHRGGSGSGRLTLFVTGDSRGYLEPCGCRRDQAGGLSGRATLIESRPREERLTLDVGNLTSGGRPYELLKLRYMTEGMTAIGYDAVNIGKTEAQLDLNTLRGIIASGLPFISANVTAKMDGKRLCESYRIVSRGGLNIGVTGVTAVDLRDIGPGVAVKPPLEALAEVVPDLKRRCDYLIVLAFTDDDTIHKIAAQFPEVNCVLGGDVPQSSNALAEINRAINFNVMDRGKVIGEIELKRDGDTLRSVAARGIKVMGAQIAPNPAMQQLIARYKSELREKRFELASAEGMERISGQESSADEFVGDTACRTCHAAAYKAALNSAHRSAYQTLVKKGSEYDPECLHCHTVGYALYSGFVDAVKTPHLANVQCESCHGRGKLHVAAMQAASQLPQRPTTALHTLRPVTPASCVRCHDEENSENFHYATFWPKVAH